MDLVLGGTGKGEVTMKCMKCKTNFGNTVELFGVPSWMCPECLQAFNAHCTADEEITTLRMRQAKVCIQGKCLEAMMGADGKDRMAEIIPIAKRTMEIRMAFEGYVDDWLREEVE